MNELSLQATNTGRQHSDIGGSQLATELQKGHRTTRCLK